MTHHTIQREIAERYHRALPEEVRSYLKIRGIPSTIIEKHRLGWNGEYITIPVIGPERDVRGFRLATIPADAADRPEIRSGVGLETELYGCENLAGNHERVVICDDEFDRLVLDANDIPAVNSTAGAAVFLEEWLPFFESIKHVYICFRRGFSGAAAAQKLQRLLPRARVVTLPAEVGVNGGITEYFTYLGQTRIDFEVLLAGAAGGRDDEPDEPPLIASLRPHDKRHRKRADRVRRGVRLHHIVANYVALRAAGNQLLGRCPFHDGRSLSFAVYPSHDTYRCSDCGAAGDAVKFVMDKESMTLGQALDALEQFQITHELYGTS